VQLEFEREPFFIFFGEAERQRGRQRQKRQAEAELAAGTVASRKSTKH
jgi:hypothetical protein